ncbi:MAG: heavy metal-associated domain-containing protein [Chitinophagaceae bacterium]
MKKIIKLSLVMVSLFAVVSAFAQKPKTETFKVSGNCGMCKKHIEGAVAKEAGVSKAVWNKTTKVMTVTYQPSKITMDAIQQKIAAAGYDTPKFAGDDKAYNELDACCQYVRKDGAMKSAEHGGHR